VQHKVIINQFEVEFWTDGYPMWTTIKHEGKEIVRVHHREVRDLEYALERIRQLLEVCLPTNSKHEA
jgi:hypothetical protein